MARLKFSAFSQAARVSNLDIDADLDMGVRTVIAAKGRFDEIDQMGDSGINITSPVRLGKTVVTDKMVMPYTVIPSENVYFTANISQSISSYTSSTPISGSIVIGPTSQPISPRLYVDIVEGGLSTTVYLEVYKNGVLIGNGEVEYVTNNPATMSIDLTGLNGGDVLTFAARVKEYNRWVRLANFSLAGDVVLDVVDSPSAERV